MNAHEKRMLAILEEGKAHGGFVSVKAEFEAEGTRIDELLRLLEIARRANVKVGIKIGGCEAVRDLIECRQFGVDYVIAPMVETPYALGKYADARDKVFPAGEREDVGFLFNVETISTFQELDKLGAIARTKNIGMVFGRVDFAGSLGRDRKFVNSAEMTSYVESVAKVAAASNVELVVGGSVSPESIDALRHIRKIRLDRFETRKIIFDGGVLDGGDIERGLALAIEFELLWLKNKRDYYVAIGAEDNTRIEMMEQRSHVKSITAGSGVSQSIMGKIRVADVIAQMLVDAGVRHVFMLTGGGAMHLNDALGRASGLSKVFMHHEQASAIGAESYARLSGTMAAVNVTTGPGGVNALNGVYGAYVDSIPMIVVSGQVKRETYAPNFDIPLRQLGDQEIDIVSMVRGITKYAAVLQNPNDVRKIMGKALWLAERGRPGPVWIDVPIDVQGSLVDYDLLEVFDPGALPDRNDESANTAAEEGPLTGGDLKAVVDRVISDLCRASRPLVLVGAGVRLSGQHQEFLAFVERLGVPVVTGWNAHDLISNEHPLYIGRPGTVGDRGGNFAVQTADFLLVLGSRLNIRQISYNWASFAKGASVTMVDIDKAELAKPTLRIDHSVHADLRDFFKAAVRAELPETNQTQSRADFLAWGRDRAAQYPVVLPSYWKTAAPVNPYCFGHALFDALDADDVIVSGDGTACVTIFQSARIKTGQRLYTNSGCASMGYDLPAAIGAWHASHAKRIICLAGDGSIMMNLQELQTIAGLTLPIKIFVLNNDGYHSIRQTQQNYFADNIVGCGPDSGLTFPDYRRLADGFQIKGSRVDNHADLIDGIETALAGSGPHLCEIMLDKRQDFAPKLASRRLEDGTMVSPSLEDMAPFLTRDELAKAMAIGEA